MLDRFTDPQFMLTALSAMAGFASVMAVVLPFLRRDDRDARLKAISKRREELSKQQRDRLVQERASRKPQKSVALMSRFLQKVNLQELAASKELRGRLQSAGYRTQSAPVIFLSIRLGLAASLPLLVFLWTLMAKEPIPPHMKLLYSIGGGAVGWFLPAILVKNQATKRQEEMTLFFPDVLDLLIICTESGLSIEGAFQRVTEEIQETSAILSEELGLTSAELAFLGDRRKAYTNLAERTGIPAARALGTALIQSEKYGTPVSQALRVLADENRQERMSKAEKKAAALPAQLTVPMIIFFLPALFLAIIGPAFIRMSSM